MNLNDLAREIHDNAVAHGFWEGERNFGEQIALMHSELSEALEEHRAGRPVEWFQINGVRAYRVNDGSGADWTTNPLGLTGASHCDYSWTGVLAKPKGVAVELADCAIRCLDTIAWLGAVNPDGLESRPESPLPSFPESVTVIHQTLSDAYSWRGSDLLTYARVYYLSHAVHQCRALAESIGCTDWDGVVARKMAYNTSRPFKHGKAY